VNGRDLCEALHSGRRVYGTMVIAACPRWPGVVQGAGLDFVFIDTEHNAFDRHQLSWMCQAYRALGIAPIVRIPEPEPFRACMVLDGGAEGIIAPYVETPEQVRALRGATKLRPLKGQRLRGYLDGEADLDPELVDYLARRNAGTVLIVNIESTPAMDALDDLLDVPGLDAVLIGPHDLSCSLGIPEQYTHPRFDEAVRTIFRKARARNVGAGIHFWTSLEQQASWAKDGANLLLHAGDVMLFAKALQADIAQLQRALGDERGGADGADTTA
jgi:4-hydroxy-2-oxoheptanedioate aldolase